MKKNDMIKAVASEADVTNKVAEVVMDTYVKFVIGALNENRDEKIPLPGIGMFSVKHVAERSGVAALAGGKAWTKPAHDVDLCQYFGHKKLKVYADFFNSSSSFCWGVI